MNLREKFIFTAGEFALDGFRARAASFGAGPADPLSRFNAILAHARAELPALDAACSAAGIGPGGCLTAEETKKIPVLQRTAVAAGANRAEGTALASLQSGGTTRTGRLETALDLRGVIGRYADLLAVLKTTGWRMGERVSALHPVEYGYFQNLGKMAGALAFSKIIFEFIQQYALYRLIHNRRNIYYAGDIFSSPAAARALLESALADDPVLLITRPDALMAALKTLRPEDKFRRLKGVLTVGTALGAAVRTAARERLGAEGYDMYASTELGYVGLTCPVSGGWFHVNEAGYLPETGADGSIIVTDFNNRLTPMLRYDTGDTGEVEYRTCACGRRGLMMRVFGRRAGGVGVGPGRTLRETDIIDKAFPSGLPFFQLYAAPGGGLAMRLAPGLAGREKELAGAVKELLGLPAEPAAAATGLVLPPSGKFCFLP